MAAPNKIRLSDKFVAIVDEIDHERLSRISWHPRVCKHTVYAQRTESMCGSCKTTQMHRYILGLIKSDQCEVDHINGNGLDNRRCNLRICTKQQNQMNSRKKAGRNRYKGVHKLRSSGNFQVKLGVNRTRVYVGTFRNEEEAALAYNEAAIKHFGEFARLNVVEMES